MDHQGIISELGGIRALARKLGHNSHTTVQSWFDRNRIPLDRWEGVIAAAEADNKTLTATDLLPRELRERDIAAAQHGPSSGKEPLASTTQGAR